MTAQHDSRPSTFLARPAGKMKEDAISALASLLQTASCARGSNMPSIQWWLGKIGEIPCHRSVCLPERIGTIDQRDIIEFGAADALWLHDPEQAGVMQVALGLRRQAAQFFGPGRALAQLRDEGPRPGDHGFVGIHILP